MQDVLDAFERHARDGAVIVSSSTRSRRGQGREEPAAPQGEDRYREIVDAGNFVCTMEWPSEENPSAGRFRARRRRAQGFWRGDVVELVGPGGCREGRAPGRGACLRQWRQRRSAGLAGRRPAVRRDRPRHGHADRPGARPGRGRRQPGDAAGGGHRRFRQ